MHKSLPADCTCAVSARSGKERSPGVWIPLRAVVFKACGSTDPMRLAGAREGYSRRCSDRLDQPNQAIPRHGCIPAESAAVSPGKIIVPRIVIGGVILDQPAGGGIDAAGVGFPCGYAGHGHSPPGRDKNALDSARSRLWSVLSVKLEKYLSRPDYEGHIPFIETFHEGLPQDGIGCPDAFPVELRPEMLHLGNFLATKSRR
jgi:hypothetical protein